MDKFKVVVYLVKDSNGFMADWSPVGKVTYTENPDDAAIFASKVVAINCARVYKGQAYSFNQDTKVLHKINK